jgi:hypothetical protein
VSILQLKSRWPANWATRSWRLPCGATRRVSRAFGRRPHRPISAKKGAGSGTLYRHFGCGRKARGFLASRWRRSRQRSTHLTAPPIPGAADLAERDEIATFEDRLVEEGSSSAPQIGLVVAAGDAAAPFGPSARLCAESDGPRQHLRLSTSDLPPWASGMGAWLPQVLPHVIRSGWTTRAVTRAMYGKGPTARAATLDAPNLALNTTLPTSRLE